MAPLPVGEGLGVGASEDARPSGLAPPSPTGKGDMSQAHCTLVLVQWQFDFAHDPGCLGQDFGDLLIVADIVP